MADAMKKLTHTAAEIDTAVEGEKQVNNKIYAAFNEVISDALWVVPNSVADTINRPRPIGNIKFGGTTTQLPDDFVLGVRYVHYFSPLSISVQIIGMDESNKPAEYLNYYNGTEWTGWKCTTTPTCNYDIFNVIPKPEVTDNSPLSVYGAYVSSKATRIDINSEYTVPSICFYRAGCVCWLNLRVRKNDGFTNNYVEVANFESGYAPMSDTRGACALVSTDDGSLLGFGEVMVTRAGKIYCRATSTVTYSECAINMSWILDL